MQVKLCRIVQFSASHGMKMLLSSHGVYFSSVKLFDKRMQTVQSANNKLTNAKKDGSESLFV